MGRSSSQGEWLTSVGFKGKNQEEENKQAQNYWSRKSVRKNPKVRAFPK
jgi:hypothetical protein